MHLESDTAATQGVISNSTLGSFCVRFTIHAGTIKIECQADSMHAIDAVLA